MNFFRYWLAGVILSVLLLCVAQLLSDDTNFGKFSLSTFQLGEFMRLDAAAARALSLLPNPAEGCRGYT